MPRIPSDLLPLIGEFTGEKYLLPFAFGDFEKVVIEGKVKLRVKYPKEFPSGREIEHIVRNELLPVLKHYRIPYNLYIIEDAYREGKIKILEWYKKRGILPDTYSMNYAAGCGHLNVLEWGIKMRILPNTTGMNLAAEHGHLVVLEWGRKMRILPDTYGNE